MTQHRQFWAFVVFSAVLIKSPWQAVGQQPDEPLDVDVLLQGGMIHVGGGEPATVGDVAIVGQRIAAVGQFAVRSVAQQFDCRGLVISPGFIDLHNHSDRQVLEKKTRAVVNYLTQGCTTIVTGNCGSGPVNTGDYYERIDQLGVGVNVAHLLPQGSLRREVMGSEQRKATADELARMKQLAARAMQDGAWGMSTGLIYVPSSYADTAELVELAKVIGRHGGIYASHIRNENVELLSAIEEALEIGRKAELPIHISHFKSSGTDAWGLVRIAAETIEKQRGSGQRITADQYPYAASSTSLEATVIPTWARAGGRAEMLSRLDDPDQGPRMRAAIAEKLRKVGGGQRLQIASYAQRPDWTGQRLARIARAENIEPLELVLQITRNGGASIVNHSMNEEDVRSVMARPWLATASDGRAYVPGPTVPHPRNYGTFPRKIGYYAIREKALSLEQAIRSATGLPSEILGLADRGFLRPGYWADVIAWNPQRMSDTATFDDPHQYSQGIVYAFVNGQPALMKGTPTGVLAGRALRHKPTVSVEVTARHAPTAPKAELGRFAKWSKIEIAFAGPESKGRGEPNPFAMELNVTFTSPSGKQTRVPGFYDGDGSGRLDGHVWKVRFSADEEGPWSYQTSSANPRLDRQTGHFLVTNIPDAAHGFWKWGRLLYTGTPGSSVRYLKFRDGPFWLKAGCDDPENFLGNYSHYDSLAKRKAAIDYLAQRGINSLYIMTHNISGDDADVWPWLGATARQAMSHGGKDARFDVAKLDQWRELFEYMQSKGVAAYLVLEDDSAWKQYDHGRYYRELVARFGYLPGLLWNVGEELNENYSLPQGLGLARLLHEIDPYDHPRGIHNVNRPEDQYVDAPYVHFTAIQTGNPSRQRTREEGLKHNQMAIDWIQTCKSRGQRVLMIGFDEGRPEEERSAWWSAYLGGGVWEAHIRPPYDRPHSSWDSVWTQLGGARAFMESLPFWRMQPANDLVQSGRAFCLAEQGHAYALYLPRGGYVTVQLPPETKYIYAWWNPANGRNGSFQGKGMVDGGQREFHAPADGDWALRILRIE